MDDRNEMLRDFRELLYAKLKKGIISLENHAKQRNKDDMTGMWNKMYGFQKLAEGIEYAERGKKPVSVIITDVDDFKLFNDTFGHIAGDELIIDSAACIQENIRLRDILSRYGGDENLIVLPETDKKQAEMVIERCINYFRNYFGERYENVGFTYGIATYKPNGDFPDKKSVHIYAKDLIRIADMRLRNNKKAKKVGR